MIGACEFVAKPTKPTADNAHTEQLQAGGQQELNRYRFACPGVADNSETPSQRHALRTIHRQFHLNPRAQS